MDINDIIQSLKNRISTISSETAWEIAVLEAKVKLLENENESLKIQIQNGSSTAEANTE